MFEVLACYVKVPFKRGKISSLEFKMLTQNNKRLRRGRRRALMKKNTYETNARRRNLNVNRNNVPSPSLSVTRLGTGLPDQLWMKMKWHANIRLETSTAQQGYYLRGNCPYDPDPKIGGDSALDYSLLMLAYRYCRVYGSKITVTGGIINNQPFNYCVVPMRQQEAVTFDRLVSDKRTVVSRYISTGGISTTQVSNYMQTRTIYGLDSIDYDVDHGFDTDNNSSPNQVATVPTYQWFWLIFAQNQYNQVGLNGSFSVTIEYDVKFFSRNYFNTLQAVDPVEDQDGVLIDDYPDNPGTDVTDPVPIIELEEPVLKSKTVAKK